MGCASVALGSAGTVKSSGTDEAVLSSAAPNCPIKTELLLLSSWDMLPGLHQLTLVLPNSQHAAADRQPHPRMLATHFWPALKGAETCLKFCRGCLSGEGFRDPGLSQAQISCFLLAS